MAATFVVHYAEIALKGKNRHEFVWTLKRNLSKALAGFEPDVRHVEGRLLITANGPVEEVQRRVGATFGVAWYSPASLVKTDYQEIRAEVLALARSNRSTSFKVEARRSDKSFPMKSQELASDLGSAVVEATGMKVDLSHPQAIFNVDVARSITVVYSGRTQGPGGLPVGTAGRVMHLFSGGIDSPAAAWLMMKRGCVPVYVHFYLAPTPAYALESKIVKQVKVLSAHGGKSTLVLVPFAEYQLATSGSAGDLEPSLFRRFMRMTCESLAPWFGASAISTGDSLSQAASQTLWNIGSFDQGSTLPILRPLLSYDKEEIIAIAKSIGTYELSLEDYKDCCAIITRHPRTRLKADVVSEAVARLDLPRLVSKVIERSTLASFNPVTGELRSSPLVESMRVGTEQLAESPGAAPNP